jgi:CheY-like chemotaxis protein
MRQQTHGCAAVTTMCRRTDRATTMLHTTGFGGKGPSLNRDGRQGECGATFTVTLPAATSAHVTTAASAAVAAPSAPGRRVLLVDDNEDAAATLADSLRTLGHQVVVAHDGPAALARVRAFQPDVALLDIGLPVMDGFELAERLRDECGLPHLMLIAITGYAQAVDRKRTAEKGFHEHLAKPIDVQHVDAILRRSASESTAV